MFGSLRSIGGPSRPWTSHGRRLSPSAQRQLVERLSARALGLALDPSFSEVEASAELARMARQVPGLLARARLRLRRCRGEGQSNALADADALLCEALFSAKVSLLLATVVQSTVTENELLGDIPPRAGKTNAVTMAHVSRE